MIRHRSADQVKRFDLFKLIVTVILILLLLFLWLSGPFGGQTGLTQAPAPPGASRTIVTSQAAGEGSQATEPAAAPTPVEATGPAPTEARAEVTAPTLNLPAGEALTPGPIALSGTGEPGSEVEVVINGQAAGKAPVNSDGQWNLPIELPQAGDYRIKVQAVDASGQVLAESEPVSLTIPAGVEEAAGATEETAAADEGTASAADEAAVTGEITPALDLPSRSPTAGEVALSGLGEPGSEVEIIIDGQVVGQATVDSDGQWNLTTELAEPGEYEVSVQTVDASGRALAVSEPVWLTVAAATEESGAADQAEGLAETTETTAPEAEGASPATGEVVPAGQVTGPTLDLLEGPLAAGEILLSGGGEPGSEVEITINDEVAAKVTVGSDGRWSFPVELTEAKDYVVRAQVVDSEGKVLAVSEPVSVAVTTQAEAAAPSTEPTSDEVGGQAYIVQADDWLSKIALNFYGDMNAYQVIIEATNDKAEQDNSFTTITDPDLIEVGQKLWIPE